MCCSRFFRGFRAATPPKSILLVSLLDEAEEKDEDYEERKVQVDDIETGTKRISSLKESRQELKKGIYALEKSTCLIKCAELTAFITPPLILAGVLGFSIYHYQSSVNGFHSSLESFNVATTVYNNLTTCSNQYFDTYNLMSFWGFRVSTGDCELPCDKPGLGRIGLLCNIQPEDSICYRILHDICYGQGMFSGYGALIIILGMIVPTAGFLCTLVRMIADLRHYEPYHTRLSHNERQNIDNIERKVGFTFRYFEKEKLLNLFKNQLNTMEGPALTFCQGSRNRPASRKEPITNFFEHPNYDPQLVKEIFDFMPVRYDASGM